MLRIPALDQTRKIADGYAREVRDCITDARPYFPEDASDEVILTSLYHIGFAASRVVRPAAPARLPAAKTTALLPADTKSDRVRQFIANQKKALFTTDDACKATDLSRDDVTKILSRFFVNKKLKRVGVSNNSTQWRST